MTKMRLLNGPCDPRDVEMAVSEDADAVFIQPVPFAVQDVYAVTDKFIDDHAVTAATGEYLYTKGSRRELNLYRQQLARISGDRAFRVKGKLRERVH